MKASLDFYGCTSDLSINHVQCQSKTWCKRNRKMSNSRNAKYDVTEIKVFYYLMKLWICILDRQQVLIDWLIVVRVSTMKVMSRRYFWICTTFTQVETKSQSPALSFWQQALLSFWQHIEHQVTTDQTGWMPRLIWVFAGCISFCWFCRSLAQTKEAGQ